MLLEGGRLVEKADPALAAVLFGDAGVGGSPAGVAVSAGAVWVANGSDGTVSWINSTTNTVVKTISVGNGPSSVAYGLGKVWVANAADGTISEIDPASGKVERTIPAAVGVTALPTCARVDGSTTIDSRRAPSGAFSVCGPG
jgi:YVTN family beta-propeller protein